MRFLVGIPITLAVALLAVGLASGETTQKGNLRLSFAGRLAPQVLPRSGAAPVSIHISGSIGTADGTKPPQLRKISIAVNKDGRVSTRGLPTCTTADLEQTTTATAKERCGSALVGRGNFQARVDLPGRDPFPFEGRALAFNATRDGKPGILLHIYGSKPVQVTFVLPFKIRRVDEGDFGTIFSAKIPKLAAEAGYVTGLNLTFGRQYSVNGEQRSFLSAGCAAPVGLPVAIYTLARGSFVFANGQRIDIPLTRTCRAR
jgi:hypothetical protein